MTEVLYLISLKMITPLLNIDIIHNLFCTNVLNSVLCKKEFIESNMEDKSKDYNKCNKQSVIFGIFKT